MNQQLAVTYYRSGVNLRVDLLNPTPMDIDFRHVADRLARIIRFNGQPGAFSVAQHSVLGAEATELETGDRLQAALFLLHDGHEHALGDIVSPMKEALTALAGSHFTVAQARLETLWDHAIYTAAGLPAPRAWTIRQRDAVKAMDARMLAYECQTLYRIPARGKALKFKTNDPDRPWPPELAAEKFLEKLSIYTGRNFR